MSKKSTRAMSTNGREEWRLQLDFMKSKYGNWNRVATELRINVATVMDWLDFPLRVPRPITLDRIREVAVQNGWKPK